MVQTERPWFNHKNFLVKLHSLPIENKEYNLTRLTRPTRSSTMILTRVKKSDPNGSIPMLKQNLPSYVEKESDKLPS